MPRCPKCGKEAGEFFYCVNCGALIKEECPGCREWVDVSMEKCLKCGKPNRLYTLDPHSKKIGS
ncbi:hypothetical protein E3J49_08220 [Candidatus Bathyarchaeota archaeon]|nr:MAG: hypothetical protein E3J49_08220 [Candidatus Bathyarchaeota archaeon]